MTTDADEPWAASLGDVETALLREAIALATEAARLGELPYASLIADADGSVLARAHNTTLSTGDVTAHPELELARWAAQCYGPDRCRSLTLYTSCEPCAMCRNVIARARLGRVVFALGTTELHALQPDGTPRPDGAHVDYLGPHLHGEAIVPVTAHYRR